ncbi:hypothetical protein ABS772_15510 [Methylorubrum podarium]|uniref:Uncharacterized protein n=1 Tax=Methylorubrum podarium TaxID=200476 RepID=A0ABV1QPP5_9HYPH
MEERTSPFLRKFETSRPLLQAAADAIFEIMRTPLDPSPSAYDPFGEPIDSRCIDAVAPVRHRARNVAVAVFWSLALLFVVGRIHFGAHPIAPVGATMTASVQTEAPVESRIR